MKKVTSIAAAAVSLMLLAGCAKSPSSIAPVAVASAEYDHLECDKMVAEQQDIKLNLMDASRRQNNAQAADAAMVFLVLVPASALVGDAEGEVAQYKGELLAVERAMSRRGCDYTPVDVATSVADTEEPSIH